MSSEAGLLQNTYVWTGAAFVLFWLLLGKLGVFGKVAKLLDDKSAAIGQQLAEAQRLRLEAAETLAAYRTRFAEAEREAAQMVAQAEKDAANLREKADAELQAQLARREKQSLARIAQAEQAAMQELKAMTADLAAAACTQIIREQLSQEAAAKLLDEAIADLPRQLEKAKNAA